jgi:hypothetical protein
MMRVLARRAEDDKGSGKEGLKKMRA